MAPVTYEVVIVGAGIMGSTTAYYLSKHFGEPSKVLLLEQFEFLHGRGSSHGESRIIRRLYAQDYYTMLTKEAFELWREAEREAQTDLLTMTGQVDFCKNDSPMLDMMVKGCKKHNVEIELLGPEELSTRFPAMKLPEGYVGLYCPEAGVIRATKAVATFQSLAAKHGCESQDNCPVAGIIEQNDEHGQGKVLRVITSTGKEFLAKKCIMVAGPWSKKLLKKCYNLELPLKQVQATVAYWKVDKPEMYSASVLPLFNSSDEPKVYGTPILEYPNLIKCCPYSGAVYCDPDDRDFKPQMDLIDSRAKAFIQKFLTNVDLNPLQMETCLLTESPDEDYIIDTVPSQDNVIIGCGFSGHGFKLSVVVGKILTELATTGQHLYPDLQEHFAVSRFSSKFNVCEMI